VWKCRKAERPARSQPSRGKSWKERTRESINGAVAGAERFSPIQVRQGARARSNWNLLRGAYLSQLLPPGMLQVSWPEVLRSAALPRRNGSRTRNTPAKKLRCREIRTVESGTLAGAGEGVFLWAGGFVCVCLHGNSQYAKFRLTPPPLHSHSHSRARRCRLTWTHPHPRGRGTAEAGQRLHMDARNYEFGGQTLFFEALGAINLRHKMHCDAFSAAMYASELVCVYCVYTMYVREHRPVCLLRRVFLPQLRDKKALGKRIRAAKDNAKPRI